MNADSTVRFGVLGSLRVADGSARLISVAAPRQRAVLATLLLSANQIVTAESLADTVWDGAPPQGFDNTVRAYVMRLRKSLGTEIAARIETQAPGYLIRLGPEELDATVFEDLVHRTAALVRSGAPWDEVSHVSLRALELWRGTPLVDVPSRALRDEWLPRLEQQHVKLHIWRLEAEVQSGRSEAVIPDIESLLRRNPLREPLYRLHMLALARAGQVGEALAVYRAARAHLIDELGVEPGTELQRLHQQILDGAVATEQQPAAGRREPIRTGDAPSLKVPRQLPVDTRVFTGRDVELASLIALARQADQGSEAGMAVISSINGMGGVGKTALAVRAGHQIADAFPDGELFIDLRGYAAGREPVTADEALDYLLRSLGIPPRSIPRDLGERAAFYRSTLADTRTLIILDNASSTAQVRPLLPGAPGCLVLVTSRNVLMGLDDTHFVALDVLPEQEAISLLRKVAGAGRVEPDEADAAELVALCGHMPLAIRIVAARLRHRRFLAVADLVAELRAEAARLDRLTDGERDLTSVFEASYRELPDPERAVFRHLGLVPGPDFDAYGVANLIGVDRRSAERLLESLLDHSLLIQHAPGRYRLHDLLRAYSRSLPAVPGEDAAAVQRLTDYYQALSSASHEHLTHWTRSKAPRTAPEPETVPVIRDRAGAFAAMRGDLDNILAMIADSAERGRLARAVALTEEIGVFLNQDGRWPQAAKLLRDSIGFASDLGDRRSQAAALWNLGSIQRLSGELSEAIQSHERAIALFGEIGDRQGRANALSFLGMANAAAGRMPAASDALHEALSVYTEIGDRRGEVNMLQQLCGVLHMMGEPRKAQDLGERALAGSRELGDLNGQAVTLGNLGRIQVSDGEFARSTRSFTQCMELFRTLGNKQNEAQALNELGLTLYTLGEYAACAEHSERALVLSRELGFLSGVSSALLGLARARFGLGDLPGALDYLDQNLAAEKDRGSLIGQSNTFLLFGRVHHASGDHVRAAEYFERALTARQSSAARGAESEIHSRIAALLVDTEGPKPALERYRLALKLAREVDRPLDVALALEGAGRCQIALGERESGRDNLREAVALYERLGVPERARAAAYLDSLGD